MRFRLNYIALLGVGLLAWPALAQTPDKPADEPPAGDSAMKQKLLDNFDTNKDGTLDRAEARAIGRALRESFDIGPGPGGPGQGGPGRRGAGQRGRGPEGRPRPDGPPPRDGRGPEARRDRGPGDGPPGDSPAGDRGPRGPRREGRGPEARGPEGRGPEGRGPEGRGRGGPDGPPRPPRPERLFNRFDENKDGSLSMEEFIELTEFVRENRPPGPPPGMRDGRGRGFGGPPARGEGRRRGELRDGPSGPPPAEDQGPEDPI